MHAAVVACLALPASFVHAQISALKEVVVSATRIEQPLADVLPSVSLITRADIERSQATSLADLLQGEAGFEFGRNGGPGTVTSFFLRGAESKNLVIMIDGVRTMVDGIGSLSAVDLPLQQIERIEIFRGNAGALYGEAAVGGVIQLFTRSIAGKPGAYGVVTLGSRNTQDLQVGYAGQADDVSYRFDLGKQKTNGFSAINPVQSPLANPDNDGYTNSSASFKVRKKISAMTSAGVMFSASQLDVDYDNSSGAPTEAHIFKRENQLFNVFLEQQVSSSWNSRLDASRASLDMRDLKNGQPNLSAYNAGRLQGTQSSLRWFNKIRLSDQTLGSLGADLSDERFISDALTSGYSVNRQLRGYFSGLTHMDGDWTWQGNLRSDAIDLKKDNSSTNASWFNTSSLLGLGYKINPNWQASASVSSGFRAPSASDLSSNINLKPETHQSQELGLTYAKDSDLVRAVYFSTRTTDAIYYQSVAPYNVINIGKVRNNGLEISAKTSIQDYQARLSLTSQDPWNETDNVRLARRSRLFGSADVWRDFGRASTGVKIFAADDRTNSAYDSYVLPGYTIVALYASYKVSPELTARVKLENAFNRPYQLAYGYNTPPSGIFVTLAYQPK